MPGPEFLAERASPRPRHTNRTLKIPTFIAWIVRQVVHMLGSALFTERFLPGSKLDDIDRVFIED